MKTLIKAIIPILLLLLSGCAYHRDYYGHKRHAYDQYHYDRHIHVQTPVIRKYHPHESRNGHYYYDRRPKPSKHKKPQVYIPFHDNNLHYDRHRGSKPNKHLNTQKHYSFSNNKRSNKVRGVDNNDYSSNKQFSPSRTRQKKHFKTFSSQGSNVGKRYQR